MPFRRPQIAAAILLAAVAAAGARQAVDGARINGKPIVPDTWLAEATRTQVSTGAGSGFGDQWWTREDARLRPAGSTRRRCTSTARAAWSS